MPVTFDSPTSSGAAQLHSSSGFASDPDQNLDAWLAGHPQLAETIEALHGLAATSQTTQRSFFDAGQEIRADMDRAKGALAAYHQQCRADGIASDPDRVVFLEGVVATHRKRLADQQERTSKQTRTLVAVRKLHAASIAGVTRFMRNGIEPIYVDVELPAGPAVDIIAACQEKIAKRRTEAKAVEKAPRGVEADTADLIGQLDAARAPALPPVNLRGKRPSIGWPVEGVNAVPAHDRAELPHATYALPLAILASYDALVAHIKQQVDDFYRDQPLVLTESEKRKRLAEIEEEILDAERVEAAATFAAHAQGIELPFREDISVYAVLGIAPA